jgi:hypothetical protein
MWRPWRKTRETESEAHATPLREFVYLDEVSVYSLYASRHGPVPEEFTATQSSAIKGEAGSSVGAGVPGLAKGDVRSRVEAARSRGTQVVRRSSIQTTFKELVEGQGREFALRRIAATAPDDLATWDAVLEAAGRGGAPPWIVDPTALRRGQLLELEVDLEAEETYAAAATTAALTQLISEVPEMQASIGHHAIGMTLAVSRILERLHAGLVPLRGRVNDYCVAAIGGREWLIHDALASRLPAPPALLMPLFIVGVAEEDLFWKDIRRVVFSRSRYSVMARLARDDLHSDWTSMKLLEVIKHSIPPLAAQLEAGPRSFLSAAREHSSNDDARRKDLRNALVAYATQLAARHGKTIEPRELDAAGLLDVDDIDPDVPTVKLRPLFRGISEHLAETLTVEGDALGEGLLRDATLAAAGFGLDDEADEASPSTSPAKAERFLDAEFVGIYW